MKNMYGKCRVCGEFFSWNKGHICKAKNNQRLYEPTSADCLTGNKTIYFYCSLNHNRILYIGQTQNVMVRLGRHYEDKDFPPNCVNAMYYFNLPQYYTKKQVDAIEMAFINIFQPVLNITKKSKVEMGAEVLDALWDLFTTLELCNQNVGEFLEHKCTYVPIISPEQDDKEGDEGENNSQRLSTRYL